LANELTPEMRGRCPESWLDRKSTGNQSLAFHAPLAAPDSWPGRITMEDNVVV
jgi:hypothetical protein